MTGSRRALLIALGAFAGCTAVALAAATFLLPPGWTHGTADFPQTALTRAWIHWDAGWYSAIAVDGYWFKPGQQSPIVFFPTYPLTVAALVHLGLNRFFAGILITAVCGVGAVWLFFRWAARLGDQRTALWGTALFALYPFAFYLYGPMYSDALFVLLVMGAFYCLETDRLWGTVLLGALATAARPVAPAVVVGLVARQVERRLRAREPLRAKDLLPAAAVLGLVAWSAYLGWKFGDPIAYVHAEGAPGWEQAVGWQSWFKVPMFQRLAAVQLPPATTLHPGLWDRLLHVPERDFVARTAVHAFAACGLLALAVPLWRRVSRGYALYLLAVVGIPFLSTKDFMGLGRYGMAAFPAFLALALLLRERPRTRWAWLCASGLLLLLLTVGFATDHYVS